MIPRSVLVTHLQKDRFSHGSSGVIIADDWVLTHAGVLHPDTRATPVAEFLKHTQPNRLTAVSQSLANYLTFRVLWKDSRSFVIKEGSVAFAWTCSLLQATFGNELQDWSIENRIHDEFSAAFLLIRMNSKFNKQPKRLKTEAIEVLRNLYTNHLKFPKVGLDAETISTPFGVPSFLNCVTQGIICNIVGGLFISDAPTMAGSEGAPVYIRQENRKHICGLVISLSRSTQCFTFGVSLEPSLRQILDDKKRDEPVESLHKSVGADADSFYDSVSRSVVAVQCGINWGTGIIVCKKKGYILTCAHVVNEASQSGIKVLYWEDNDRRKVVSRNASLVYATADALAYDVAVLRVKPDEMKLSLRDVVIESAQVPQGETVAVVGYPFSKSSPTISRGIVAKFSAHMLQTTCCVQSGTSGGPVVRWPTGQMIGLVVCNIVCPMQNEPQPRFNFAIPSSVFKSAIDQFCLTDDSSVLKELTSRDESVQRDWQLSFLPRAKL